jgi:putative hemolysin
MTREEGDAVRDEAPLRPVDVRARHLWIRLAETQAEIEAAQELRYRVFVEEMGAQASDEMASTRREFDAFDPFCDHLLIFDTTAGEAPGRVIGTYRFMRREQAKLAGQFYTESEYDIRPLLDYPGEIMELGRSCVDRDYRTGGNMQVLWRGITAYVLFHEVALMFGCGSLHGTDVEKLAQPLAYLHHYHLAPEELRPRALAERYTNMNLLPKEAIDARSALHTLPPLVKGYLRLGGFIGDGAVVDHEFGTTDVCVVVKTDAVTDKYRRSLTRGEAGSVPSGSEGG